MFAISCADRYSPLPSCAICWNPSVTLVNPPFLTHMPISAPAFGHVAPALEYDTFCMFVLGVRKKLGSACSGAPLSSVAWPGGGGALTAEPNVVYTKPFVALPHCGSHVGGARPQYALDVDAIMDVAALPTHTPPPYTATCL